MFDFGIRSGDIFEILWSKALISHINVLKQFEKINKFKYINAKMHSLRLCLQNSLHYFLKNLEFCQLRNSYFMTCRRKTMCKELVYIFPIPAFCLATYVQCLRVRGGWWVTLLTALLAAKVH